MKLLAIFVAILLVCSAFAEDAKETPQETKEEIKGLELLPQFLPANVSGQKYCPTEDIWRWKQAVENAGQTEEKRQASCPLQGICDNLDERNRWRGRTNQIRLYVTVLCATATSCPLTQAQINAQVNQVNMDFSGTNFSFVLANTAFRVDATYATIPAYSQTNSNWYTAINNLKNIYSVSPTTNLNVFITRQTAGTQGTLLGIGTFPWDSAALRPTGGLWMNANFVGGGYKTTSHEIGHCIGLWHTFHGDSEVSCNSACYEVVHQDFADTTFSNTVGDYCADTPSQPMNYNCANPTGRDCRGNLYTAIPSSQTPTLTNNIMAYTPDNCMQRFTPQQAMRSHCWVCRATPGWGNSC